MITAVIFIVVSLGVGACFLVMTDFLFVKSQMMRQRMDNEFRRSPELLENKAALFKNLDPSSLGSSTMASLELGMSILPQGPPPDPTLRGRLDTMIEQADLEVSAKQILTLAAVLGMSIGAAATVWLGPIVGLVGAAIGAAGPLIYVRMRRDPRRERFLNQIPAAFGLHGVCVIKSGSLAPQRPRRSPTHYADCHVEFSRCARNSRISTSGLEVTFHEMGSADEHPRDADLRNGPAHPTGRRAAILRDVERLFRPDPGPAGWGDRPHPHGGGTHAGAHAFVLPFVMSNT